MHSAQLGTHPKYTTSKHKYNLIYAKKRFDIEATKIFENKFFQYNKNHADKSSQIRLHLCNFINITSTALRLNGQDSFNLLIPDLLNYLTSTCNMEQGLAEQFLAKCIRSKEYAWYSNLRTSFANNTYNTYKNSPLLPELKSRILHSNVCKYNIIKPINQAGLKALLEISNNSATNINADLQAAITINTETHNITHSDPKNHLYSELVFLKKDAKQTIETDIVNHLNTLPDKKEKHEKTIQLCNFINLVSHISQLDIDRFNIKKKTQLFQQFLLYLTDTYKMDETLAKKFLAICIRSSKSGFRSDIANKIYNRLKKTIGIDQYIKYVLDQNTCKAKIIQMVESKTLSALLGIFENQKKLEILQTVPENKITKSTLISLIIPETRPLSLDDTRSRSEERGFNPFQKAYIDPKKISIINQDQHCEEIKALICSADFNVKITTLSPPERGSIYYNSLITALADRAIACKKYKQDFSITFLFGNCSKTLSDLTGVYFDEKKLLDDMMEDIAKKADCEINSITNFQLCIASYNPSIFSWNHSKVAVADDGKVIIIGGQNMFKEYTKEDEESRVRDVSIKILDNKEMGLQANTYIDQLINASTPLSQTFSTLPPAPQQFSNNIKPIHENIIPNAIAPQIDNHNDNSNYATIIPTYGSGSANSKENQSASVVLDLINNATTTICISQQSIIFMYSDLIGCEHSNNVIMALNNALKRGVKINIIISPEDHTEHTKGDYTGSSATNLKNRILADTAHKLRKNLIIKTSHCNKKKVGNHAKVLFVDDLLVHVGSHNLYDNSHAECSILFEGKESIKKFKIEYWDIEWSNAQIPHSVHNETTWLEWRLQGLRN
jgi:hypothetical protein